MCRFAVVFSFFVLLLVSVRLCHSQTAPTAVVPATDTPPTASTVELTVDFGDGFQKRFTQLPYRPNMTVLDLLTVAREHPRGMEFQYQGKEATAFVTSVDQVENRGATGPNWIFRVNDQMGKQSCAITKLQPGDAVLWRFEGYD